MTQTNTSSGPFSITFSFGDNWKSYASRVTEDDIRRSAADITNWLGGAKVVAGKRVLDIGCGSGIHSLSFHKLGVNELQSFDYDPRSVETTRMFWRGAGESSNWTVQQGSVLDATFLEKLGFFDIVYSWGVLHHTGAMWNAIRNAATRVKPGGIFWITIYQGKQHYARDLALKKKFNRSSWLGKRIMVWKSLFVWMLQRCMAGQNPFEWNRGRGMNVYHDVIDWLGGLPYEVAAADEVIAFCQNLGFASQKFDDTEACISYLFVRNGEHGAL